MRWAARRRIVAGGNDVTGTESRRGRGRPVRHQRDRGRCRRHQALHRAARNVVALFRETVERNPDRPAVVELDGPRVSYAELAERASRVAGGLSVVRCRRLSRDPAVRHATLISVPVEVENVLAAHPGVVAVAVVGVAEPVMGEKVGAVVLPWPGSGADVLVPSLIACARAQLADFEVPQYIRVLAGPLPRNAAARCSRARCGRRPSGLRCRVSPPDRGPGGGRARASARPAGRTGPAAPPAAGRGWSVRAARGCRTRPPRRA